MTRTVMNYWSGGAGLAGLGCGSSCGCRKCRETAMGFAESYERDEPELGEPAPVPRPSTIPVFSLQCNACHRVLPYPPLCREELRQLIMRACRLAAQAAQQLETNPKAVTPVFREFFSDDPLRPVPAASNKPAGNIVAARLRQAEEALRLRGTLYRCEKCDAGGLSEAESMGGIIDAFAIAFPAKNEVWLCPGFWTLTDKNQQAGILLHEMMHLKFAPLFRHDAAETKGTSAYCHEGFVLQVNGHSPEMLVRTKCRSTRVN